MVNKKTYELHIYGWDTSGSYTSKSIYVMKNGKIYYSTHFFFKKRLRQPPNVSMYRRAWAQSGLVLPHFRNAELVIVFYCVIFW